MLFKETTWPSILGEDVQSGQIANLSEAEDGQWGGYSKVDE